MVHHFPFNQSAFSHSLPSVLLAGSLIFSHILVSQHKRTNYALYALVRFLSSSLSFHFMCIYRRRLCLCLWLRLYLFDCCATQFSGSRQKPNAEPPVRLMEINNDAFSFLLFSLALRFLSCVERFLFSSAIFRRHTLVLHISCTLWYYTHIRSFICNIWNNSIPCIHVYLSR